MSLLFAIAQYESTEAKYLKSNFCALYVRNNEKTPLRESGGGGEVVTPPSIGMRTKTSFTEDGERQNIRWRFSDNHFFFTISPRRSYFYAFTHIQPTKLYEASFVHKLTSHSWASNFQNRSRLWYKISYNRYLKL